MGTLGLNLEQPFSLRKVHLTMTIGTKSARIGKVIEGGRFEINI